MRFVIFYLFAVVALACDSKSDKKPVELVKTDLAKLIEKRNLYLEKQKLAADGDGWIDREDCDGLLFHGLLGSSSHNVNIDIVRDSSGKWHRRPDQSCFKLNLSSSENSNDMRLGMFWYFWKNGRLDLANQVFDYGRSYLWKMGENRSKDSRHIMSVPMQATLAEIIYRLGGNDYVERKIPYVWSVVDEDLKPVRGYRAHLMVLHILLIGSLHGGLTDNELKALEFFAKDQPENPLFVAVYAKYSNGDMRKAMELLLDEKFWPNDRLSSSNERCESWVTQREMNDGRLQPCGDGKIHTGGDFTFAAAVVMGEI